MPEIQSDLHQVRHLVKNLTSFLSFQGIGQKLFPCGNIPAPDGARLGSKETVSVFNHQNSETALLTETVSKLLYPRTKARDLS